MRIKFRGIVYIILMMAFMLNMPGVSSRLLYAATPSTSTNASAELPDIQAAFIYNLMKFTTWPVSTSVEAESIKIGLIGHDNITKILEQKLSNRRVQKRAIVIEYIDLEQAPYDARRMEQFHLIYIAQPEATKNKIDQLNTSNALLVSNYESFIQDGGTVGVVYSKRKNKVVLQVSLKSLNQKSITLSSKLLKIAAIVE